MLGVDPLAFLELAGGPDEPEPTAALARIHISSEQAAQIQITQE